MHAPSDRVDHPDLRLLDLIRSDIEAARRHFGSALTHAFPNLFVAVSHRFAHTLHRHGHPWLAQVMALACHVLTGAEIRPTAQIGPGLMVIHPTGIVIGGNVVAGRDLQLWGSNTLGRMGFSSATRAPGSPRLGDSVVLLTHASVVGAVVIGDRVVVAAYSLVLDDMSDDSRPRGVPARSE